MKVVDECINLKDEETPLLAFDVLCLLAEMENPILNDDNIIKIITYICSDKVIICNIYFDLILFRFYSMIDWVLMLENVL